MIEPILIGIIGASSILISFFLDLFDIIEETSKLYLGLNIFGGLILSYYAFLENVIPFLILNIIWTIISIVKLIKSGRQRFKNPKTKSV
jgi:large-conductance mechanosensitive channel